MMERLYKPSRFKTLGAMVFGLLLAAAMAGAPAPAAAQTVAPKPVVGQYFGIFLTTRAVFNQIVDSAPFDKTNLVMIAFLHTYNENGVWVADYENARANGQPPAPGDTDADRIDYLVAKARAKNPAIKILVSLGWGTNDAGNAALTPSQFAASVKAIVAARQLDGFDIDYESTGVSTSNLQALASALRQALPGKLLTITPAQTSPLNGSILANFDLVQPQTYDHGGNGTTAEPYATMLGGWGKIVYGLNSEGPVGSSDDPATFAALAKSKAAAGIFAWRLDTDSQVNNLPTYVTAIKMWSLMTGQQ